MDQLSSIDSWKEGFNIQIWISKMIWNQNPILKIERQETLVNQGHWIEIKILLHRELFIKKLVRQQLRCYKYAATRFYLIPEWSNFFLSYREWEIR